MNICCYTRVYSIHVQTAPKAFLHAFPTLSFFVPLSLCSQSNAGQPLFISSVKFPQDTLCPKIQEEKREKKKKKKLAISAVGVPVCESFFIAVRKKKSERRRI